MNLDCYFPTPIWWEDIKINNSELLELCQSLKNQDPNGRQVSNVGGWQSNDLDPTEYPELSQLTSVIYKSAYGCLDQYGFREGAGKLNIGNIWFNSNQENHANMSHIHNGSFFSGVYYVKAARDNSDIVFYKNNLDDYALTSVLPTAFTNQLNGSTAKYPPRTGRLIIFPAWIPHAVLPNNSKNERISIAFNLRLSAC